MLVGARKLIALIADTETSRAKLASVVDLLDEASTVHGVFLGPLPEAIDAARRTVGRLCGVLPPPAAYLQIDQCRVHLAHLGTVFTGANANSTRCAEILRFADDSPQWQRWRRRMDLGADQSREAGKRLYKANARAADAYLDLVDLVRYWHRLLSLDRATEMATAEDRLRAAMKVMDEALAAMRQMLDVVARQATEMTIMILAQNEASAGILGHRRRRSNRTTRGTGRDCNCM